MIELAEQNSPAIKSAQADLDTAKLNYEISARQWYPTLDFKTSAGLRGMIDGSVSATEIASKILSGKISACAAIDATLARIASINPKVNAFTDITAERARQTADALDARRARG